MPREGFEYVQQWDAERWQKGFWHSFELPDGSQIAGVLTLESLKRRLAQFPIAQDLTGKTVLDIGCWDGWFSFELERRGAQVTAIDNWDNPRFRRMHDTYHSHVDYRQFDMYELTPERVGRFDIVLFMGVLYHLKHPLLALERVCALTKDMAAVDSFILREGQHPPEQLLRPILEFYETDEMGGQADNWFGPSLPALMGMCRVAGFARVELCSVLDYGAQLACYRKWPEPEGPVEGPVLQTVMHAENFGVNFRSDLDNYVSIWFESPLALTRDNVQPEVSGFGSRPMAVTELREHFWQVNFKLPPLPRPGWHEVRVRLENGRRSNALRIAVDVPLKVGRVRLGDVCDGTTWQPGELDTSKGTVISFWVHGLPENADLNNVKATLGDQRLRMLYLEPLPKNAPGGLRSRFRGAPARQANASLTETAPAGNLAFEVRVGSKVAGRSVVQVKL